MPSVMNFSNCQSTQNTLWLSHIWARYSAYMWFVQIYATNKSLRIAHGLRNAQCGWFIKWAGIKQRRFSECLNASCDVCADISLSICFQSLSTNPAPSQGIGIRNPFVLLARRPTRCPPQPSPTKQLLCKWIMMHEICVFVYRLRGAKTAGL